MPLNPSGAISLGGPTTGQSIAVELGLSPTASISLNGTDVRTLAGVPSGAIVMPTDFWGKSSGSGNRVIFGYGATTVVTSVTNLVSNTGVVASDTPGVGTARTSLAATEYGGDKAIFGFGATPGFSSLTNLVSNAGVVASDTPGVGTARSALAATGYGSSGQALFAYGGASPGLVSTRNLVSNTGVVASDTSGSAPVRSGLAAARYGGDKAIFGYGSPAFIPTTVYTAVTNLVSNTGVIASSTPGVGTARNGLAAAGYAGDKAIFGFGFGVPAPAGTVQNVTNLVSNTGVVASNTPGVGTARTRLAAATYGTDKAIFGYGLAPARTSVTNLVSNTGVVASDTPGVGTERSGLAAAAFN
jgi:hypothetical protein